MKKKGLFIFLSLLYCLIYSSCSTSKIAICAHRGYWLAGEAEKAQNSIASLKSAQAIDVWGSEFDVHLTSDNVMIVNHDDSLDGLLIWDNPWSSFEKVKLPNGERPATLSEYLRCGQDDKTVLVCELKPQKNRDREITLANMAIEEIKKQNLFSPNKVIFISFSYDICKHLALIAPNFMIQYLSGDKTPEELKADGIMGIDYHYSVLLKHPDWVKRAHKLGMSVNAWTVNKKEDIEKIVNLGVDCITTNYPLRVRGILSNKELRKKF